MEFFRLYLFNCKLCNFLRCFSMFDFFPSWIWRICATNIWNLLLEASFGALKLSLCTITPNVWWSSFLLRIHMGFPTKRPWKLMNVDSIYRSENQVLIQASWDIQVPNISFLFSKSNIPSRRSFNGIPPLRRPTGKTKSQYKGLPYDKHTTKTHRKSRHSQCQPFHVEGKDINMSMNHITCEITTSPMYSICWAMK